MPSIGPPKVGNPNADKTNRLGAQVEVKPNSHIFWVWTITFCKSKCGSFLDLYAKFCLHTTYGILNVNALMAKDKAFFFFFFDFRVWKLTNKEKFFLSLIYYSGVGWSTDWHYQRGREYGVRSILIN